MTTQEKIVDIRKLTMAPMNKISEALKKSNDNVDEAVKILINQMTKTDIWDMKNRIINARIVYSYVHNNRIGAMITLGCQTDFVAKNEQFLNLAKDICIHIVSSPNTPRFITETEALNDGSAPTIFPEANNKPENIREKIIKGKLDKWCDDVCLLRQKFVKNEDITIKELIQSVSSMVGEKIEVVKFIRMTTNG